MGEYRENMVYHVDFFFGNMLQKEVFGIGKQKNSMGNPFLGGGFKYFFMFIPIWGRFPI